MGGAEPEETNDTCFDLQNSSFHYSPVSLFNKWWLLLFMIPVHWALVMWQAQSSLLFLDMVSNLYILTKNPLYELHFLKEGIKALSGEGPCPGPHSQYLGLSDPKSMRFHPTPTALGIPVQPTCPEDVQLRFVEKMEIGPFFLFLWWPRVILNPKGVLRHPIN